MRLGALLIIMPDDYPLHYRVQCAMCPTSLNAESDNLKELFEIAIIHVKEHSIHPSPSDESKIKKILNSPNPNLEVFRSKGFRWNVTNMLPFDTIEQRVKKDIEAVVGPH